MKKPQIECARNCHASFRHRICTSRFGCCSHEWWSIIRYSINKFESKETRDSVKKNLTRLPAARASFKTKDHAHGRCEAEEEEEEKNPGEICT